MIEATDLNGVDPDLALRVIAYARSIASCLDSLVDPQRAEVIAVLKGVAATAKERGSLFIKSQRIGPAAIEYTDAATWFTDDDRATLRAYCAATAPAGGPVGYFPRAGIVNRVWPEREEYR